MRLDRGHGDGIPHPLEVKRPAAARVCWHDRRVGLVTFASSALRRLKRLEASRKPAAKSERQSRRRHPVGGRRKKR
jgi:hypothetical protein